MLGPIEVKEIPGKGKGMICSEHCPAGTLLFAERLLAFAITTDDHHACDLPFNETDRQISPATRALAQKVVRRAEWDAEFLEKVNQLDPGEAHTRGPEFNPDRLSRAVEINCVASQNE